MPILIQSFSWTLIYAIAQGAIVFATLCLLLRIIPSSSSASRYRFSLLALTTMLVWFAATWLQKYHLLLIASQPIATDHVITSIRFEFPVHSVSNIDIFCVLELLLGIVHFILPWLPLVYFFGLLFMFVRLSIGARLLYAFRRQGILEPSPQMASMFTALVNRIQLTRPAQLLISVKAQVPMVIGFIKPIVLLPVALSASLTTAQLEAILLHELAHIRRHDYLINMLQTIVETILFFNPFVWLISSIVHSEREHCCDDVVLAHTHEPTSYATALAALASSPAQLSVLALAASGRPTHLYNRIKRIMEMKTISFSYGRMFAAACIVVLATYSVSWLVPAVSKNVKSITPAVSIIVPSPNLIPLAPYTVEAGDLIQRLLADHKIVESEGFTVEIDGDWLYINGSLYIGDDARKYLCFIHYNKLKITSKPYPKGTLIDPNAQIIRIQKANDVAMPALAVVRRLGDGC